MSLTDSGLSSIDTSTSIGSEGASSFPSTSPTSTAADSSQLNGPVALPSSSSSVAASTGSSSTTSTSLTGQTSASSIGPASPSGSSSAGSQSTTSETTVSTSSADSATSSAQPSSSGITTSITSSPTSSSSSFTIEGPDGSPTSTSDANATTIDSAPISSSDVFSLPSSPSSWPKPSPSPSTSLLPPDGTASLSSSASPFSATPSSSTPVTIVAVIPSPNSNSTPTPTPQAVPSTPSVTALGSSSSSPGLAALPTTSGGVSKSESSVSHATIIAGVTGSFGGVALLIGLIYLMCWCRKREKSRDSIVSTDPLWRRSNPQPRESFGNDLDLPLPTPPPRRGHSSGMDMVQVSDDPFGATPPSFPQLLDAPSIVVDTAPFDAVYGETPSSATRFVHPTEIDMSSPGWERRAVPVIPAIRIQSASTDDYAEDDRRSSYAESMVPLDTPDENFPNPFVDPVDYVVSRHASSASVSSSAHSTQSGSVLKNGSQARLVSRTNSRLTMGSFRAEYVPSPVDSIDRFWDLPTPGPYASSSQLSVDSPSSSESLLRSMSPGPGPTTPRSPAYAI